MLYQNNSSKTDYIEVRTTTRKRDDERGLPTTIWLTSTYLHGKSKRYRLK